VVENARALAENIRGRGLRIVSGGTDNHLLLLDVGHSGLTGKEVEAALDQVHITVNKNTIPFETKSPFVTSGIRIGTPAVTTRGLGVSEMQKIAGWVFAVCETMKAQPADARTLPSSFVEKVKAEVGELCSRFPLYK
jgi:glycine hydroxymethyltransferase